MASSLLPRLLVNSEDTIKLQEENMILLADMKDIAIKQFDSFKNFFEFYREDAMRNTVKEELDEPPEEQKSFPEDFFDDVKNPFEKPAKEAVKGWFEDLSFIDILASIGAANLLAFEFNVEKYVTSLPFFKNMLSSLNGLFNSITNMSSKIIALLKPTRLLNMLSSVKAFFMGAEGVAKYLKPLTKMVASIGGVIKALLPIGKIIATIATPILNAAKLLGRFAPPIQAILGIIEFFDGFFRGFRDEGILGGLREGIANVIGAFIGFPIDLLKRGVAWLAGEFGFEEFKERLNSINLEEELMNVWRNIFNAGLDILRNSVQLVIDGFGWVKDQIQSLFDADSSEIAAFILKYNPIAPVFDLLDYLKNIIMNTFSIDSLKEYFKDFSISGLLGFGDDSNVSENPENISNSNKSLNRFSDFTEDFGMSQEQTAPALELKPLSDNNTTTQADMMKQMNTYIEQEQAKQERNALQSIISDRSIRVGPTTNHIRNTQTTFQGTSRDYTDFNPTGQ